MPTRVFMNSPGGLRTWVFSGVFIQSTNDVAVASTTRHMVLLTLGALIYKATR